MIHSDDTLAEENLARGIAASATAELGEPSLSDLVLAITAANQAEIARSLLELLSESNRYAAVLDHTAEPIRRQALSRATRIDQTNISKVTGPLAKAGWLRVTADAEGVVFRRSIVVDALVRGRSLEKWRKDAIARLSPPRR